MIFILRSMFLMKKLILMLPRQSFFDSYGHAVVPLLGGLAIRDINAEETQTLGYFFSKTA